ncbi:hypothetical protein CUJ84_Chr004930 [Rhizobium leguminosarum]|uniref:Uncharacterized protein n=1 Tax=Rhizobium leguminosarum TaxID=384 RepID=A0A2K9ZAF9_RHILE|nr:hypothetical protein CUJ84_Chr004930 [Rhizobium leguminosarum]
MTAGTAARIITTATATIGIAMEIGITGIATATGASGIATEMGATAIVTGATTIKGTIGKGTIGKEVNGRGTTGEAMIAGRTAGTLIAAPAIPPATNETERGRQRRPLRGLKPGANTQEKARRSHEGCTGPDVDRRVLRGDGRSCAGREGLSRFSINNRDAYWFRLLH